MKKKIIIAIIIATICVSGSNATRALAAGQAMVSKEELKKQKAEAEGKAKALEGEKSKKQGELNSLNSNMESVSKQVQDTNDKIAETQKKISDSKEKIKSAEKKAKKQYDDMKIRIQFMYENTADNMVADIFYSKNMAEFLNRAQYVSDVFEYDRKKLDEYQETLDGIKKLKSELEAENKQLSSQQQKLKAQENVLNANIQKQTQELKSTTDAYNSQKGQAQDLDAKIKKMEAYEAEQERKRAEEEARRQKQGGGDKIPPVDYTGQAIAADTSDEYLLAAIIQCEAGGESYAGQVAVGSVVVNRVHSPAYPSTIAGVVYQSGQFTPAGSGRLALVIQNHKVSASCQRAAKQVLAGNINTKCLHFCVNTGNISGTVIDNQVFY